TFGEGVKDIQPDGLDLKLAAASLLQNLTSLVLVTQSYEVKR
ncbi:130_t:CDS:2, partial [Gigaspora rosea]